MSKLEGMKLAQARLRRGLTQAALAEELGLSSKGSVSAIETGAEPPSLELALRIQQWSGGEVLAADLRPDLAHLIPAGAQPTAAKAAAA